MRFESNPLIQSYTFPFTGRSCFQMTDYQISVAWDAPDEELVLRVFDLDDPNGDAIVDECNVGDDLDSDALYNAFHQFHS